MNHVPIENWMTANRRRLDQELEALTAALSGKPAVRPGERLDLEPPARLDSLCAIFDLGDVDRVVLLLAAAQELSPDALQGRRPTVSLARQLAGEDVWTALCPQSALRRCIELFNHSTRFFIVVEDKCKLLRPILSRFCEIHVPEPVVDGVPVNLHAHLLRKTFAGSALDKLRQPRAEWLEKEVSFGKEYTHEELVSLANKLHERAYSGVDLLRWLEARPESEIRSEQKYERLISFQKVRHEFRNEKLLMLFMLHFMLFRSNDSLENISFM